MITKIVISCVAYVECILYRTFVRPIFLLQVWVPSTHLYLEHYSSRCISTDAQGYSLSWFLQNAKYIKDFKSLGWWSLWILSLLNFSELEKSLLYHIYPIYFLPQNTLLDKFVQSGAVSYGLDRRFHIVFRLIWTKATIFVNVPLVLICKMAWKKTTQNLFCSRRPLFSNLLIFRSNI